MTESVVVVGTGLAGYTVAREFRKLDKQTSLHLVTRDDGAFYSKPMLSNALASGKTPEALATFSAEQMASQLDAKIHTGVSVDAIHPDRAELSCTGSGGEGFRLGYRDLVLALGARPNQLLVPGREGVDMMAVNNLQDYAVFRERLKGARHVTIIGAGFVGCEFANDLAGAGYEVDLMDIGAYPLSRLLTPLVGAQLRQALAAAGINWLGQQSVEGIQARADGIRLDCRSEPGQAGTSVDTDLLLSAVGLQPVLDLATAAGIRTGRAIEVDRRLQTSIEHIHALGDCAQVDGLWLPFVMPIMHAARTLAKILAGETAELQYPAMPVVVKTPCYPLVLCLPPPGQSGQWREEETAAGARALFHNDAGQISGFILGGDCTAEKNTLLKNMPGPMSS